MKKNYWLVAIFLLMAGATAWYTLSGKKDSSKTLGWDRLFKVPAEEVHKIFIAKRNGETTTLVREGDHWVYNGKWKASENAMENIMEVVTSLELQSVPPPAATPGIVKEMAARGIKVEIFGKGDKKLKAYYIGGVTADARGTCAIMDGSEQPMYVQIPQMLGQLRTRFELEGDAWRDRHIFEYKPEQIKAISVEYPQQRNLGFKLSLSGGNWDVKPFYDNVPPINRAVSPGRVEGYLVGYGSLLAEAINNDYPKKDSVRNMVPFSVITVTNNKDEVRKASFYPTYRADKNTGERRSEVVERYFTDTNAGDWFLTQHRVFEKVFWAYESFFEPPPGKK